MALNQIDITAKVKLDSEFSTISALSDNQLRALAIDYEILKASLTGQILDIAGKLRFIYDRIQTP